MEADDPRRGARKSAPGQPWTHSETMHLIDVYEDRWTKLRRGQLKAHQWEDVAGEVTRRCGGQRKTGTQCRHKLEKLRKRYRTEAARPVASLWPFFRRMERLERGPVPVATNSFPASDDDQDQDQDQEDEEDDDEEEQEEEEDHDEEDQEEEEEEEQLLVARNSGSQTRSINGLVRDAGGFRGQQQQQRRPSPPAVTLSTAPPRKRVSYEAAAFQSKAAAADRLKVEEAPAVDHGSVAGVLRDIGEGIKRLERRRMEVQWEIERGWKETEARSNQILQDAQRELQDALAALPPPGKKARRDHGSSADGL